MYSRSATRLSRRDVVERERIVSVVVDEGETDELASEVRVGLSAGGGSLERTRL